MTTANRLVPAFLLSGALLLGGSFGPAARPAEADTATTAAIIAGAAAIVGALIIDSNKQPYYVKNNRRYYVSQPEANYWKQHHHVVQRPAYVPEQEYPIARNPNRGNQHR